MLNKTKVAALAIVLAALIAPAAFSEEQHGLTARVSYAGVDLASEAGAEEMLARIDRAARRVCPAEPLGPLELGQRDAERVCRQNAVRRAVTALNSPLVTSLHAARLEDSRRYAAR